MPQNSTPTFSHPKTTAKNKKIKKNKEDRKIRRNSGEAKLCKIDVKTSIYATKVIPESFTHIRGRFRQILYVEHRRQGRRNVEFLNFSRSESVRPLQTKSIPKTRLGGRRDSEIEKKRREKGRRNDVNEEREKSQEKRAGNRVKKTKSDPRAGSHNPNRTQSP